MNHNEPWTQEEYEQAKRLKYECNWTWRQIGEALGRKREAVRDRVLYRRAPIEFYPPLVPPHCTETVNSDPIKCARECNAAFVDAMREHHPGLEIPDFETPKAVVTRAIRIWR